MLLLLLACAAPPPSAPARSPSTIDWSLAPAALARHDQPYRLERDESTGLVCELEMAVDGSAPSSEWPTAFIAAHPELFGPAEAFVADRPGQWHQRFGGIDVTGSSLEAMVNAAGRYELRARLAPAPTPPAPDPASKPAAIAAARAWLPTSEFATRAALLDSATATWYDPGLLAPPSKGSLPAWLVTSSAGGPMPGRVAPSAAVVVDATSLTVLGAWDRWCPPSQAWGTLQSYLPKNAAHRDGFDRMLPALALSPGETVADVGAGSGALSWPLAEVVGPKGHVIATDVDPSAVAFLRHRLIVDPPPVANVEVRHAFIDDPRLDPASTDGILLWETHFFMAQTPDATVVATLEALHAALRPGGRLVVMETLSNGPEALVRTRFEAAGFTWVASLTGFPGESALAFGP